MRTLLTPTISNLWITEPSDYRAAPGCVQFIGQYQHELCLHLKNVAWAAAYLRTSHLASTDMDRELGALPLWERGAESPSNTMWPGPRPTCVPSFILIHPTRLATIHQRHRQDRTDRQRSDSTGRTKNPPLYHIAAGVTQICLSSTSSEPVFQFCSFTIFLL